MVSSVKEVENIAESIRKMLSDDGAYSPSYDVAIYNLSQAIFLKDSVFNDALAYKFPDIDKDNINSSGSSIIIEQSREGFLRYKNNPAYSMFLDYTDKVLKILDSMGMTVKSSNAVQDDEFTELKNKMEKAANGK